MTHILETDFCGLESLRLSHWRGARWQFVYQMYLPSIDTLVTIMCGMSFSATDTLCWQEGKDMKYGIFIS